MSSIVELAVLNSFWMISLIIKCKVVANHQGNVTNGPNKTETLQTINGAKDSPCLYSVFEKKHETFQVDISRL